LHYDCIHQPFPLQIVAGLLPTTGRYSRSTGSLESKSDDGSNLDEDNDAWENLDNNLDFDNDEDDIGTDENHPDEPPFVQPTEEPGENSSDDDGNDTIDDNVDVPLDLKAAIAGVKLNFRLLKEGESFTPKVEANTTKCRLKRGVADLFRTPAECIAVCGGLTESFVVRLQAKSNDFYHSLIKPGLGNNNKFLGLKWDNITKAEMYRFLGIVLQISMNERDGGGYKAYFAKDNGGLGDTCP
jgi:hypothetical protein